MHALVYIPENYSYHHYPLILLAVLGRLIKFEQNVNTGTFVCETLIFEAGLQPGKGPGIK